MFENNNFDIDEIYLVVKPSRSDLPLTGITENGQFKINLSWEPKNIQAGSKIFFEYEILDVFLKDRPMSIPYELKIYHEGNEILSVLDVSSGVKSEPEMLEFFIPSDISGVIELQFEKLDGSDYAKLTFPIAVHTSSSMIPEWVKNTAGWWADNEIPDSAFVNAIQYLIKEGIMVIS